MGVKGSANEIPTFTSLRLLHACESAIIHEETGEGASSWCTENHWVAQDAQEGKGAVLCAEQGTRREQSSEGLMKQRGAGDSWGTQGR